MFADTAHNDDCQPGWDMICLAFVIILQQKLEHKYFIVLCIYRHNYKTQFIDIG